jgi:RHS repeat-associated protein
VSVPRSSRILLHFVATGIGIALVGVASTLNAQGGGGFHTNCVGGSCTPPSYAVIVTPDAQPAAVLVNKTSQRLTFTVKNMGQNADSYYFSCTGDANVTCTTYPTDTLLLNPDDEASEQIRYSTGSATGISTLTFRAWSVSDDAVTDVGSFQLDVSDQPAVTLVVPGAGVRALVHDRQPVIRSTFLPRASAIDTSQTVFTFRGETVSTLARHNRGLLEWEVDSTRWLRTGLPGFSGVDSALASIKTCSTAGYCETKTQWIVLANDSTPVLGFTGMPLENLGGGFSSGFGPGLSVSGAEVETGFSVPSYVSMGASRSTGLVYSTRQSYPRALVNVDLDLPWPSTTPSQVKLILSDAGVQLDVLTLTGGSASCLTGSIRRCRATLQADFSSGTYATPTRKWLTVEAQITSGLVMKSSTDSVEVVVVDRRATHYGSGWWPAGISQLVAAGQDRVLVGSTGTATVYRGNGDSVYVPSPGNFTALVKTTNGWELRPRGSGAKTLFDTSGRLAGTVDINSNVDTVIYNGSGDVATLTDPVGKSLTFAYDGNGHIASITDPGSRVSKIRVNNTTNQLTSDSFPVGPTTRVDTTAYSYQSYPGTKTVALLRRLGVLAGDSTKVVYDSTFNRRPRQAVLATVQNESGGNVNPTITYTAYQGRGVGALVSLDSVYVEMKDPRSNWTRSLLNRWGESRKTWDSLGVIGQTDYLPDGRVNWSQGKNGDTTRVYHTYDAASRLVRSYVMRYDVSPSYLRLDSLVYDTHHRVTKRIDSRGQATQFFYDALGRDTLTITPDLAYAHTWYRADGLPEQTLAPLEPQATSFIYESTWKNVYRVLDATGDTLTTNTYDTFGRLTRADRKITVILTSTTDTSQWRRTETFYNDANQVDSTALWMSQHCKPIGGNCNPLWELISITRQRYDVAGRDTGTTNNVGVTATYHYDLLGRVLASRTWADSVAVKDSMVYDVAGNLKLAMTRRGTTITHYYDSRNRDTLTTIPGVGDMHHAYTGPQDQLTRLWYTNAVDSIGAVNGELRWAFDRLGRMVTDTSYTGSVVRVGTHAYDLYERPSTLTDAIGTWTTRYETARGIPDSLITPYADSIAFNVDAQGRPAATIVQSGLAQRATIALDWSAGGKLTSISNGVASAAGAYNAGELTRPYASDTSAIPLAPEWWTQHSYGDPDNHVERDSLQYDALERLTSWVRVKAGTQVGSETYGFDGNDNVSQSTGIATYDPVTDRLVSRINGTGVDYFYYDRAGNMIRMQEGAGPNWEYGYDPLDRLVSVRRNTILIARYGYDVAGRRIVKRVYSSASGGTAGYLRMSYRGDQVAFETDSAGSTIGLRYEWGMGTDQLLAVRDAAGHHFYTARDLLGSIRTLTKRDGTWLRSERFSPYGTSVDVDSATAGVGIALRYGWTGREYDAETGFYFLRARYYSPSLRRFVQADPIGTSGGSNVYAYAGGSPLEASDPSGLRPSDGGGTTGQLYGGWDKVWGNQSSWDGWFGISGSLLGARITYVLGGENGPVVIAAPIEAVQQSFTASAGSPCPPCEEGIELVEEDGPAISEAASGLVDDLAAEGEALADYYRSSLQDLRDLGLRAEQAVGKLLGLTKNTQVVNGRIPDFISGRDLIEVKNVGYQAFTGQLRDYMSALELTGGNLTIYTRPDTHLSGPLQYQVDIGRILQGEIPNLFGR